MIKLATIWGAITGAREWLTLLAVAGAAAWLYAQYASVRHDRDQLQAFADIACADAGASFAPGPGKKAGAECRAWIRDLAAFKRDTNSETARILADAMADQQRKTGVDAAHARRAAEAARAAAEKMGEADAAITEGDRVGAAWFGALNDVAGLRPPAR